MRFLPENISKTHVYIAVCKKTGNVIHSPRGFTGFSSVKQLKSAMANVFGKGSVDHYKILYVDVVDRTMKFND